MLRNTCGLEDHNDGLEIHHGCAPTINTLVFDLDYENPKGGGREGAEGPGATARHQEDCLQEGHYGWAPNATIFCH